MGIARLLHYFSEHSAGTEKEQHAFQHVCGTGGKGRGDGIWYRESRQQADEHDRDQSTHKWRVALECPDDDKGQPYNDSN